MKVKVGRLALMCLLMSSAATGAAAAEEGKSAPAISAPPPLPPELFDEAVKQKLPGSPDQIIRYRQMKEEYEKAKNKEVKPVTPVISTTVIRPGEKNLPPTLHLRVGYSTTVVFHDASGAPFKVTPVGFGDNKAYKVQQVDENTLTLFATKAYRPSNMTVLLDGMDTPLVLHLTNGTQEVDYVRTFTIQRLAPATRKKLALSKGEPDPVPVVNDKYLTRFLDDLPPEKAQVVPVLEPGVQAWYFNGRLIVRTRYQLLSPDGTPLHGSNGIRVYEIATPMPALLFSHDGKEFEVHLVLDQVDSVARAGGAK